ncbi:hypothetical protein FOZ63_004560 [Perkinsus olseni]|uniref:Dynein light chain n=1 Tax=Perkinsus olseni TaxID=32597 RepID=A0A7J6QLD2_PEROL|nr:hypothetical protein FOZ63_004560 [Perkinsus olseni]
MPEGKNVVSDMDENSEMRTDAVTQASIAIQKYETESEMAKHIKAFFDGKYDPNWMCVVGESDRELLLLDFRRVSCDR